MRLIIPSPAKVNLSLWVKGKRPDGYHEIITVMHTIGLNDFLYFLPSDRFELSIRGTQTLPLGKSNLITKAVKAFEEATGIKARVKIQLEKVIPVGAGLGGGSSNAAATLKGLNKIYGEPLKEEELKQVASQIGSDVPFFIKGGLAVAYGKGEKLKHYGRANFKVLLVYPGFQCFTEEVYKELPKIKREITVEEAEKLIISPLITGKIKELKENMVNDLQESRAPCIEKVKEVKIRLEELGFKTLMSGSGSSVFSVLEEGEEEKLHLLKSLPWWHKLVNAV